MIPPSMAFGTENSAIYDSYMPHIDMLNAIDTIAKWHKS